MHNLSECINTIIRYFFPLLQLLFGHFLYLYHKKRSHIILLDALSNHKQASHTYNLWWKIPKSLNTRLMGKFTFSRLISSLGKLKKKHLLDSVIHHLCMKNAFKKRRCKCHKANFTVWISSWCCCKKKIYKLHHAINPIRLCTKGGVAVVFFSSQYANLFSRTLS